jgi:hypothetical protein
MSQEQGESPHGARGRKRPLRLRGALARPGLHIVFGVLCTLAFTWPFLTFGQPSHTWIFLHGAWMLSVGLLFLMSLAERRVGAKEREEDVDDG